MQSITLNQYVPVKNTLAALSLVLSLLIVVNGLAQTDQSKKEKAQTGKKMARADMKAGAVSDKEAMKTAKADKKMTRMPGLAMKEEKATPADYKAPVDRSMKGPNDGKVMTGPREGKYYINKNGNKTCLSNQRG